jgi:uncharacterized protein (UPF0548 family)
LEPSALDSPPPHYRQLVHERVIGRGDETWNIAKSALLEWRVSRGAGLMIWPRNERARLGQVVLVGFPRSFPVIVAPCAVCEYRVTDTRVSIAYRTLPGHPESGVERFEIVRDGTGEIKFIVRAVSRPRSWPARVGGPLARALQGAVTRRYVKAMTAEAL